MDPAEFLARTVTPKALSEAWAKYVYYFGEAPHGTERQMACLLQLVKEDKKEERQVMNG